MKISREIKTAILVLGAIALFIWGYSFLKGRNIFDNSTKYYVNYDNVEGLTTSSPVTVNGLVVGKVSKIDIDQQTGKLQVELLMTHPIQISKNSTATIYAPSFIGGKSIAIDPLFGTTDYAVSGDVLKGEVLPEMVDKLMTEIEPLKVQVETVLKSTNQMLTSLNTVLDEQTQNNIKLAIASLQQTITSANQLMSQVSPKMNSTMTNLDKMSGNFAEVSSELNSLDIKATFTKLDQSAANLSLVMEDLQNGKGSVGMLLKDEQLYANLSNASKELELLLRDLKENPKRYVHFSVFGKKAKPYVGEEEIIPEEE